MSNCRQAAGSSRRIDGDARSKCAASLERLSVDVIAARVVDEKLFDSQTPAFGYAEQHSVALLANSMVGDVGIEPTTPPV
jgi:hypothetical protein